MTWIETSAVESYYIMQAKRDATLLICVQVCIVHSDIWILCDSNNLCIMCIFMGDMFDSYDSCYTLMCWKDSQIQQPTAEHQEGQAPPAKSQVAVGPFTVKPTWGDLNKNWWPDRYPAACKQNIQKWYEMILTPYIMVTSLYINLNKTFTCIACTWSSYIEEYFNSYMLAQGWRLQQHNLIPDSTGKKQSIFFMVNFYIYTFIGSYICVFH